MPEVFVTKADGTKQLYDKNKVVKTCLKMGASQKNAEEIAQKIENRAYEGISTKKILQMIFIFMRRYKPTISNVYDLRTGISVMSPKPEFELFVRTLLENHGFKVEPNQILIGKCTTHEVDAIARKDANTYFIEAKHHQSYHSLTGLDESRIARAIFEDITESYEIGKSNLKIDRAMLITNTRFSYQAVQYGNCRNILQIGWNEPKGFSLQKLIEEKKLYPLSCIKGLRADIRMKLVFSGIVLIKQLLEKNNEQLKNTGLPKEILAEIKEKAQNSAKIFSLQHKH